MVGWTPYGHYEPAIDNAPLRHGWELIARVEGTHIAPAAGDGNATTWWSATLGFHWEVFEQLRLQADVAYEKFDANAEPQAQVKADRVFGQVWATFRL